MNTLNVYEMQRWSNSWGRQQLSLRELAEIHPKRNVKRTVFPSKRLFKSSVDAEFSLFALFGVVFRGVLSRILSGMLRCEFFHHFLKYQSLEFGIVAPSMLLLLKRNIAGIISTFLIVQKFRRTCEGRKSVIKMNAASR